MIIRRINIDNIMIIGDIADVYTINHKVNGIVTA